MTHSSGSALAFRPHPEADAERYRAVGWWPQTTLVHDIYDWAVRQPRHAAIVSYRAGATTSDTTTYGQLTAMADRFAASLVELGVEKGNIGLDPGAERLGVRRRRDRCRSGRRDRQPARHDLPSARVLLHARPADSRVLVVPGVLRGFDHAALAMELVEELDGLPSTSSSSTPTAPPRPRAPPGSAISSRTARRTRRRCWQGANTAPSSSRR